jgi:hypothetical protein
MANHVGSEGTVKVGANTVAEVTGWSLDQNVTLIDDTEMSDATESHKAGPTSWGGSIDCFWDETDSTGQLAMTVGTSVTLNLYPEGATTGDYYYTGAATVESISISGAGKAIVSAKFKFKGSGTLTGAAL